MSDLRVERGRATRERLLEAGRELFGERGYEATSIEALLGAAGVARGALYHHFETKEALFDAVLDAVVAEMAARVQTAVARESDPVARLRTGCATWLRMALDPAVQRIALVDAPAVVGWRRWRELDERYILGGLRAALEDAAAHGRLALDDVEMLTPMLLASVNEAALMVTRAKNKRAALARGQAAIDALLERLTN